MEIANLLPEHWNDVKKIYEEGIATGKATFEINAPDWDSWNQTHLPQGRFVCIKNDEILGWTALTAVSGRCVYAGVAEVSIYISEKVRGEGFGKLLLNHLITESEKHEIWTLQAGIFAENTASIRLHETCGFRTIGYREKIGKLNNEWKDVFLLERRSKIAGTK
ncbi:GNAT family N-acetyltransferase [Daejeonella oryzae]|uniref:GNAT family N-acetyltransferase n=1 Tax=Daejeonella oryzae TaxID=1122943 RepID=UPI0003F52D29|nr:GNAT family N-acetyltransferase [Daejeonella oryzae]